MRPYIIHLVMAARPNVMKVAPLYYALKDAGWADVRLVHTGQHYDENMLGTFLKAFKLPAPHYSLNIGSGTYAEQTARTMVAYERLCYAERPDACIVVGDVNATVACAITAKKMHLPVIHLEAGLRAFDRNMPEEINRIVTDSVSDLFWSPSDDATQNLISEGVRPEQIDQIGNIMIDAYCMVEDEVNAENARQGLGLPDNYALCTFHRPSNVDDALHLNLCVDQILSLAGLVHVVFPVHPRTRSKLEKFNQAQRLEKVPNITLLEPLSYIRFMSLLKNARLIVTDSGGVQEESSYLGVPCLTLRPSTERPVTIERGTNELVCFDTLLGRVQACLEAPHPTPANIQGWDGKAALRAAKSLNDFLQG